MTTKVVLLCLCLSVALLGLPSRAHPFPGSLDRSTYGKGRLRGRCSEHAVVGSSSHELEHAPGDLAEILRRSLAAVPTVPTGLGCLVRVAEEGDRRVGREGGRGEVEVCSGRVEGAGEGGDVAVVRGILSEKVEQLLYLLFSCPLPTAHNLTVLFQCGEENLQCLTLHNKDSLPPHTTHSPHSQFRRAAMDPQQHSDFSHTPHRRPSAIVTVLVVGGVSVLGIVGLLAALALCAHDSDTYDPEIPKSRSSEVATSESVAMKSESQENLIENNSSAKAAPNANPSPGPSKTLTESTESGHSNRSNSQLTSSGEFLIKPRSGSGRGSDPLPGIPTLETAGDVRENISAKEGGGEGEGGEEEDERYASVEKKDEEKGAYDYVENEEQEPSEDKAEYAYARVRGAAGVKGRSGSEKRAEASPLPPYGKVTRHLVPVSSTQGKYSEVRSTSSPALPPGRVRAHTDPIDPSESHGPGVRGERALTESAAHLPLPQIPKLEVNDEMYDSIPDEMKADAKSKPAPAPVRDSLYESVDEARDEVKEDEDMYESVPDDMRQATSSSASSPPLSPTSPVPLPPRSPSITRGTVVESPVPPPSPKSPSVKKTESKDTGKKEDEVKKKHKGFFKEKKDDEGKRHKALAKTVSDSSTEHRGRSLSSLFHKKKAGTVSGGTTVTKVRDTHEPLPAVPTGATSPSQLSPPHLHPPDIPIPLPPDEDDDVGSAPYDMPDVLNPRAAAILNTKTASAKGKSASLPASMRSAGALVYNPKAHHGPLPDVPEESAGGVVSRLRRKESFDPNYDTVVLEQVHDDPNYDSVEYGDEEREQEDNRVPKLEPAQPGDRERQPEGKDHTPTRYARVTKHIAGATAGATAGAPSEQPPDESAYLPDHDELGYAVIPAHLKMRKRTRSEAMRKRQQDTQKDRPKSADLADKKFDGPVPSTAAQAGEADSVQNADEPQYESVSDELKQIISPTSTQPPASRPAEAAVSGETEDPYSTVDIVAKRRSQILRQQSGEASALEDQYSCEMSASQNPPPLPQQGDLGDLSEFDQPPIPAQMEGVLQLIDPPYARVLEHPGSGPVPNPYAQIDVAGDPPYASINKKPEEGGEGGTLEVKPGGENDPPYATINRLLEGAGGGDHATNDPPYAKINKGRVEDAEETEDPGYEKAGIKLQVSGPAAESEAVVDEAQGYDTVGAGSTSQQQTSTSGAVNGEQVDEGRLLEGGSEEDDHTYDRLNHGLGRGGACGTNRPTVASARGEEAATVTVDFRGSPASPDTVTNAVGDRETSNGGPVLELDAEVKTISFAD